MPSTLTSLPPVTLGLIVPCHNEEEALSSSAERLLAVLSQGVEQGRLSPASRILLVDDGSRDGTWALIAGLAQAHPAIVGLRLSRNFGHQSAVLAGIHFFTDTVDCTVSIDADLQQDEAAIATFVDRYREGAEIVFGVRTGRESDGLFKKATALGFYRLMRAMGVRIIENHADYRLLGRRAMRALRQFRERNLFLRGICADMGFPSAVVHFQVRARRQGASSYTLTKMLVLAFDAIIAFSNWPLRFLMVLGLLIFAASGMMGLYALYTKLFTAAALPGWASTVLPIYFLGGCQILALGIVGEYLGRTYMEVKARPRYLVDTIVGASDADRHDLCDD